MVPLSATLLPLELTLSYPPDTYLIPLQRSGTCRPGYTYSGTIDMRTCLPCISYKLACMLQALLETRQHEYKTQAERKQTLDLSLAEHIKQQVTMQF